MVNAVLYWLNTGIPSRNLPEQFGPRRWPSAATLESVAMDRALFEAYVVTEIVKTVCWLQGDQLVCTLQPFSTILLYIKEKTEELQQ